MDNCASKLVHALSCDFSHKGEIFLLKFSIGSKYQLRGRRVRVFFELHIFPFRPSDSNQIFFLSSVGFVLNPSLLFLSEVARLKVSDFC